MSAVREGSLVLVLPGWEGSEEGGIYAVVPPGRLIPDKDSRFCGRDFPCNSGRLAELNGCKRLPVVVY